MNLDVLLNYKMFSIPCPKYYLPLILIEVREYNMKCTLNNSIIFFMENPRTNIELISAFFEFYFEELPSSETQGQVSTKSMIVYRKVDDPTIQDPTLFEFIPCILFTQGSFIHQILIYLPVQILSYLRELKYMFLPRSLDTCSICLEEKKVINVHQNQYSHHCCLSCLLCIEKKCPICRLPLIF